MEKTLQKYLRAFQKLRMDRSHGVAPHKPILLISVLQAFQNNIILDKKIYITPELVALFKTNWSLLVTTGHDCRFALPFFHLTGDKFWRLVPKRGFENILMLKSSVRSLASLNAAVECATVNEDLLMLMKDSRSNEVLIQYLLGEYFQDSQSSFTNSAESQIKAFDEIERKILNDSAEEYTEEIRKLMQQQNEEEIFLRGSLFKREIPKIYDNRCCISGMKIDATISVSMVDACHIIPFSESYDDTVTNGITLCPNLHRAFDRGLIGIDQHYEVLVSDAFREEESSYSIREFEGTKICLPSKQGHFPSTKNFEWHRKLRFK